MAHSKPIPFTPARIYTLGPKGTFSDKAAQRLLAHLSEAHLPYSTAGAGAAQSQAPRGGKEGKGKPPRIVYTRTIPEVLSRTEEDHEALGIFPIENSDTGTVVFAQDRLVRHKVVIELEINVRVSFSLLANAPLDQVKTVYAQPVACDQCSILMESRFPAAKVVFTPSNIASGRRFLATRNRGPRAAIVPPEYGEAHSEFLVDREVQNHSAHFTRFLVVRARGGETRKKPHTIAGHDFSRGKTSLLIEPREDYPGLLYELLRIFNKHRLNLCRLESRPAKGGPWTYVFFLDVTNNEHTAACLKELDDGERKVTVLGSFDTLEET